MPQPSASPLHDRAMRLYQQVRARLLGLPATAQVLLGVVLIVGFLLSLHLALATKDSALHLKVQHSFRSADLSVWVDGHLATTVPLRGAVKKRFGLIPESIQGGLTQSVPVSSGRHEVRVRVQSEEGAQEDSVSGEFPANGERDLSVTARHSGVSLAWQNAAPATSSTPASGSGFSRYAGAVLLTIIGSIISALTGFALRELPPYLRARQAQSAQIESSAAGR